MTTITYKCPKCGMHRWVSSEHLEFDGVPICFDCNLEMEEVEE
jgi:peptide subunit release factor 1 (eRF1)